MNFSPLVKNREVLMAKEPLMSYKGGDFVAWQNEARSKLSDLLGMDCFELTDPRFVINSTKKMDSYTEYSFTIFTEKTFSITSTLLIPDGATKAPLLISLYGDTEDLDFALGRVESKDRDVCVASARAGYATLALVVRNFDDCPATSSKRVASGADIRATWNACYRSTMRASILGRITMGERVWDISRMIDAVLANFDVVDGSNITLIGNSGCGTLAYYAAAIDTRITATICSSGIAEWEDSIAKIAMCSCNFIPLIANYFRMSDISGLVAPRKLSFLSYSNDTWFPSESCRAVTRKALALYKACGSENVCFDPIGGDPLLSSTIVVDLIK